MTSLCEKWQGGGGASAASCHPGNRSTHVHAYQLYSDCLTSGCKLATDLLNSLTPGPWSFLRKGFFLSF